MKTITKCLGMFAFSIFLCVSQPVIAQNDNPARTVQTTDDDDNDDAGKWGLAGLLGLLGLLGLRRRNDDINRKAGINR